MLRAFSARISFRRLRPLALAALVVLPGCASLFARTPPASYGQQVLYVQARKILDVEEPTPAFYRERARLEVMGKELDEVLIRIVEDGSEDTNIRANALVLLADRRAFGAEAVLRRILVYSAADEVRLAAATGLARFTEESPSARNALVAALSDPSARVRLAALQELDVEEAAAVRRLAEQEDDAQVRLIARQLLTLFEERGAPLARDERGIYRTTGADTVARIVFQPSTRDTVGRVDAGALWVEVPGESLVPLAQVVEVVDGVVPAFFNTGRSAVVYEAEREVRVRDLRTGQVRVVGPGLAPRLVPFSDRFVFVREVAGSRRPTEDGMLVDYAVLRSAFGGGAPEAVGTLRAVIRPDRRHGASPVRWMVVGEVRDGFALSGDGIVTPFPLQVGGFDAQPR